MNAQVVLQAMAILGGVGLVFAALIAAANRKLRVWEDPRIDGVAAILPGANCGACGSPGCRAFAEKLVGGKAQPAQCTVSSPEGVAAVANYLGVSAGSIVRQVARVMCAGDADVAVQQAQYDGYSTCVAAASIASGGKGCRWGCVGLADCERACTFGAIRMTPQGLPVVDPAKCTACGDCVEACPKDLFVLMPAHRRLLVQCRSLLAGEAATAVCKVACTGCGLCVTDATTPGLLRIEQGALAVLDVSKDDAGNEAAVRRCPTGAIVWLGGEAPAQFAVPRPASRGSVKC